MSKLSKPTRQTRQGSRAQHNGDLRNQGPVKIAEASSPIFGMPWCSHGASIVVDERQSIPCLKISGKDLRKVVLQDLDLQDLQNSPHRPTLPMMAMMAMMASRPGRFCCIGNVGNVATVAAHRAHLASFVASAWHQKNQSIRLTSRDSDVSNVAKLKNILSTYDYKIFQIQSPSIFHHVSPSRCPSFEPSKSLSASRRLRRVTKRPPSRTWPRVQRRKLSQDGFGWLSFGYLWPTRIGYHGCTHIMIYILWYTYNVYRYIYIYI